MPSPDSTWLIEGLILPPEKNALVPAASKEVVTSLLRDDDRDLLVSPHFDGELGDILGGNMDLLIDVAEFLYTERMSPLLEYHAVTAGLEVVLAFAQSQPLYSYAETIVRHGDKGTHLAISNLRREARQIALYCSNPDSVLATYTVHGQQVQQWRQVDRIVRMDA